MADFKSFRRQRNQAAVALDEFGGTPDGGLAIVTDGGEMLHRTPPRVAASLRYFLAKATGRGDEHLPERLALTAALRGEGVTFTTLSIASVLAYDSDATVAVVDLNWTSAPREGGKDRKKRGAAKPTVNGSPTDAEADDRGRDETPLGVRQIDALLGPLLGDEPDDGHDHDTDDDTDPDESHASTHRTGPSKQAARRGGRNATRAAARATGPRPGAHEKPAPIRFESPDGRRAALIDAIEERASVDDILVATSNPRLSIVNAGEVPLARRPSIAASASLQSVIDQVAKRFDHVLLDLPPVLASSDAIRLSQLADAYALVVRHGVTTTRQVESALDELSGVAPLGVILNRYATRIPLFLRRLVGA